MEGKTVLVPSRKPKKHKKKETLPLISTVVLEPPTVLYQPENNPYFYLKIHDSLTNQFFALSKLARRKQESLLHWRLLQSKIGRASNDTAPQTLCNVYDTISFHIDFLSIEYCKLRGTLEQLKQAYYDKKYGRKAKYSK